MQVGNIAEWILQKIVLARDRNIAQIERSAFCLTQQRIAGEACSLWLDLIP